MTHTPALAALRPMLHAHNQSPQYPSQLESQRGSQRPACLQRCSEIGRDVCTDGLTGVGARVRGWGHGLRAWCWRVGVVLCAVSLSACSVLKSEPPPAVAQPLKVAKLPVVGLALGGGAARGFAHVGVLQVLDEAGIRIDLLAGTSAGSVAAVLYASGLSGNDLEQAALALDETTLTDWMLPWGNRGLLRGAALAKFINTQVKSRPLQAMPIPVGVLATQLDTGAPVLFQRGDAGEAVRASSAVPGVFMPVAIGGQEYVDGGVAAPVPVSFAKQMGAQVIVGVDISSPPAATPAKDTLGVMLQTFAIMGLRINGYELAGADVVVRPQLNQVGSADFAARRQAIAAGRAAMLAALPAVRAAIAQKTAWVSAP
jgi:NTE family protein